MKSIFAKLVVSFLIVLLLIAAVGVYASIVSQQALQTAIGLNSELVADEMLAGMNMIVYNWLDRQEQRALGSNYLEAVNASNREFEAMASIADYMTKLSSEWQYAANGVLPASMQEMITNELSQVIQRLYFTNYERLGSTGVVAEVIITNRYGAAVALTGAVGQYRYDANSLWLQAKDMVPCAGDVELHRASGRLVVPLAVVIPNNAGQMAGVILTKIYVDAIVANLSMTDRNYESTQFMLATLDGRMIYSSLPYQYLDDISDEAYFREFNKGKNSFVVKDKDTSSLFSFATSRKYQGFPGMNWILAIDNELEEILLPSILLRNGIILVSGVLLLVGLIFAVLIALSITRPLVQLQKAVKQISLGNMNCEITLRSRDELGVLADSFREMQAGLINITLFAERISAGDLTTQIVKRSEVDTLGIALEKMLLALRRQTREILDGALVVAGAAKEIFASTSQFAVSSLETAAAVNQTTTTIEQLKQTVHLSNEKAKHLADKARKTEERALAGRISVEESTMVMISHIHEQMGTIGDSIMKLSEQSASIGDITTTVNDLADQSNLLAVNAAIEAAKAGEQGKGFAVVAQEIKSLAEQSKRATAQVRSLLTDIQKATSGAVMATEQGSKAVDQGMQQAGESKESIKVLAETVSEAALGAAQIAASSQEQLIGMDQVAMAMENIKVATGLGVDKTKSLEAEAQNLHAIGQNLKVLAELFRL